MLVLILLTLGLLFTYNKYGYLVQSARNWPRSKDKIEIQPISFSTPETDPELSHIMIPDGFAITYYAPDVPGARSMVIGDDGTLYVGTRSEGVVYALIDENQDGRVDTRYVVASDLDSPNGVAYKDGDLYVAEISRIIKFPNIDDTFKDSPTYDVIFDDYPSDSHHGWKYIAFGPDDNLYIPVGAPCNICDPVDPHASITKLNPNNEQYEIIARGIRNTVGFDWNPDTGNLWFTDNGRDWLGNDSPPDELNVVTRDGQHFGYPYCHGGDINDPDFSSGKSCQEYVAPIAKLDPHVAALGVNFYQGQLFPQEYNSKLFIAEHGSWNRTTPIGYRITVVDIDGDTASNYQTFAEGWLGTDGEALGRPVDIIELSDGSLLVSDDLSGAIYRITYSSN